MGIADCLHTKGVAKERIDHIQGRIKSFMDKGMSEKEAGIEVVKELHKSTHNDLNALKKSIGIKTEKYISPTAHEKTISDFNNQIKITQDASTQTNGQQQEVVQQGGKPEHARTEQTGSEGTTTSAEGGDSNIGSQVQKEIVPPPPILPSIEVLNDGEGNIYTHAGTAVKREALGLPERTPTETKKSEQLNEEADAYIRDGKFNVEKLDAKANDGKPFDDVERVAYHKYAANLDNKLSEDINSGTLDINSPEFDTRLKEVEKAYDTLEKAGTNSGRSLQSIQNSAVPDDTLAGFFVAEMQNSNVDVLTSEQKEKVQKEFTDLQQKNAELQKLNDEANAKLTELEAKLSIAEEKKNAPKGTKKTKEQYAKEREDIYKSIRDKWNNAGKDILSSDIPYRKQIAAIAPDVYKLAKNLVADGIDSLEDIVKSIHETLKPHIPELQSQDIQDILAGSYNKPKPKRSEVAAKYRDLQQEAKMLNQLASILSKEEPTSPKYKVARNSKLKELSDKIDAANKETKSGKYSDIAKVKAEINRNKVNTEKVKQQLAKGDFAKPEKPQSVKNEELKKLDPELYKKRIAARDAYLKAKEDREIRMLKEAYAKRSRGEIAKNIFRKAWNTPKALLGTADVSFAGRQGIWNVARKLFRLNIGTKGIGEGGLFASQKELGSDFRRMYASLANEKVYRRMMADITESPRFEMAKKAGLSITDVNSPLARAREELYGPNYAEEIPFLGKSIKLGEGGIKIPFTDKTLKEAGGIVKASERAFTAMGMLQRWEHFNQFADAMENRGLTFEKDPQAFKEAAIYANQASGVGYLGEGKVKSAQGFLSTFIWSTKLAASRLQLLTKMLNPEFYYKTPKEVRNAYLKDMISFVAMATSVAAISKYGFGFDVEDDPRSSDFMKVKAGDTRYDILGGTAQWVVFLTKLISGQSKTQSGDIVHSGSGYGQTSRLDLAERFVRGKATPEVGSIASILEGKNLAGETTTPTNELLRLGVPLIAQDIKDVSKEQSVKGDIISAVLSAHGVGISTYPSKEEQDNLLVDWSKIYDVADSKKTQAGSGTIIKDPKTREERKMTSDELEKFQTKRDEIIKRELDKLKKNGIEEFKNVSKDPKKVSVKKVVTPSDKITVAQMRNELRKIKGAATTEATNELFPETPKEKVVEGIIQGLNEDLNLKK